MRVPRIGPPLAGLLLVVGLLAPGGPATHPVLAVSPTPFVEANGTSLTLGGFPFKLRGAAIYGTSNPGGPASASQVLDWAAAAHLNTIRLVNMFDEGGLDDLAPYDETNWAHVDQLLEDISARGMHALLDLSAFRNHLVHRDIRVNGLEAQCQAGVDRTGFDYTPIDPYRVGLASEWQAFIDFVTARTNTVTGLVYRDDPTIAVISIAGEPQPPESEECGKATDTAELTEFYRRTLEMLHDDDANHLRSSGGLIHLDWQQLYGHSSGIDGEAIFALADNTLPALHTYPPDYQPDGTPIDYQTPALGPYATGLGKPWFTEEFGWTQNVGDAVRASRYEWLYNEQKTFGSSGALFWNLGPEVAGGSHDANPYTPLTWNVIVDPEGSWADAGSITAPRIFATATRLPSSKVLLAGGQDGQGDISDVRVYDPQANAWTAGAPLSIPRSRHTATLLTTGKVFVTGGLTTIPGQRNVVASTAIYDPATNSWAAGTSMPQTRYLHTATELADHRILVAGGIGGPDLTGQSSVNQATAHVYDPVSATWAAVPDMSFYRYGHTAVELPTGKVLVAGGEGSAVVGGCGSSCAELLDSAELYDPATNTWTVLPDMDAPHAFATATLLDTGKVLVVGGDTGRFPPFFNDAPTRSAELFDPATNTWSLATSMGTARSEHVAGLLPDGRVLVAGGFDSGVGGVKTAELYDPISNNWSAAADMSTTRWFASAIVLDDGSALVAGGAGGPSSAYLSSSERLTLPPSIAITPAPGSPASVAKLGRFEQQFRLDRTYGTEANDPTVIEVTGRFVAPSGAIFTVPAYFGLDYTVQAGTGVGNSENYLPVALDPPAPGIWHVRFSPDEVGTWTYTLRARDHVPGQETTAISGLMSFQVTPSSAHGQVERDPRDDRFLRYQDGTPYYPMGHNVAFQQDEPEGNDGEHYVEPLFASMEAAGQNWTRIWMTDFDRNALEWYSGHWAGWYTGVGHYADQSAFRIERQLDVAEEHGLQVQLVFNDHGQVSSRGADRWNQNPYNAANGGPVAADHPEAFFTNAEARELFKHRLRYLVARYGAYRNVLAWELFNEAQFVGSDAVNPSNNAQIRTDIVAWHAEMAAYLRSIDPYQHLITTSSDIESSLKDIWADPNIDLVQVHDYDAAITTRDARFRGYVASLNAAYQKPVIIGEFGIFHDPEINFDPVTAAPLDDRGKHLLEATHLHNAAWASAMSGSGAMSWWWGAYIHSSPTFHRAPPDFPANERINPPLRDFFAGEDLAGMSLHDSNIAAPASVVALGLDNGSRGFAWIRDAQNEYGTGAEPGDIAGRTMSGVRVAFAGFADGTYRVEVHDPWGANPVVERLATSVDGTLSVVLPDFTRDVSIKIRPAGSATGAQPVTVTVTSPNGGPVDITESTTPASPPAGSGYTFLAFQLGITAPTASAATPLTIVFTVDKALLDSVDPDLTADTLSVFRNDVPVPSCTVITTDPPAMPDPCVNARETLVGGADAGDVRITVLSSAASRWNFGVGPARANQTITFGNLANRTMLQSPVTVTATASSGLPVSFSTTTPTVCTSGGPNGGTITLVGAGTCTVKADQLGNASFSPAPSVSRSFTVSRVSQLITFNALPNRTMLQTPFTVSASASSLLAVTFASTTPSVCTTTGASGSTVDLVSPGTCTIVASQAGNATYAPALDKARSFTVSLARQVITFTSPGNKTLIQSPVTVSATSTSPQPVTFTTTTPAVCTSGGTNGATITLLTIGSCSVVASQPATSVYSAATPVTRTFTVSQATQTITFGALPPRSLGQSPFTVSATASSGLTVTFTTSSGSVCTAGGTNGATITLLKAGTCRVVASQAGNATYKAAPNVTQSFTVTTN